MPGALGKRLETVRLSEARGAYRAFAASVRCVRVIQIFTQIPINQQTASVTLNQDVAGANVTMQYFSIEEGVLMSCKAKISGPVSESR